MPATLRPLPLGRHGLVSARPEPDLAAHGYEEVEYRADGRARAWADDAPAEADFATRVVVRRPAAGGATPFSGTLLVEWLNVSSGMDAAPDWTFAAEEILRAGHAWAGVSAQLVGVEGGAGSVRIEGVEPPGGLRGSDPERYGDLHHPGDAYCYGLFGEVAIALRDLVDAERLLAVGESQSATTLVTYLNHVQPEAGPFDGFLVHSRLGIAAPLGEPGAAISLDEALAGPAVPVRDDVGVPVLLVQAEGDLFDRIGYLPARQPDSERLRLWEVAGAAHADRYVIGEFEEILGSPVPVNRGQQWAVVRAAVRALDTWVRDGVAPPVAARLEVTASGDDFVRDGHGNVRGGVRTPVVDAPVEVLSGRPWPGAPPAARLFGSTRPLAPLPWGSAAEYLAAYEAATDAAIAAGFVLDDDRDAVLAEARTDLFAEPTTSHEEN